MASCAPSLKQVVEACCPDEFIRETAREVGAVKRQRKVRILALFWTLVFGAGEGARTLTSLRQAYQNACGVTIASSAFQGRFTEALAKLFRAAVERAVQTLAEPLTGLEGRLGAFLDLVAVDSTVLRLPDLLAAKFPGCRTNQSKAALKVNVITSVGAVAPRRVKITSERHSESKMMTGGKWMAGRLLLFDLGYFGYRLFRRIAKNAGFFVSRLKENANPRIVENLRPCRGQSIDITGHRLRTVLGQLQRQVIDCLVEVKVPLRSYNGASHSVLETFRVVGLLNDQTGCYHLYITNVSHETLSAEDIARVYGCRWEIELFFKELKGSYHLADLPSQNVHAIQTLIYASILTLVASRKLLTAMRRYRSLAPSRTPERRWARCFRRLMEPLLRMICNPLCSAVRKEIRLLLDVLAKEMVDPNASRARNLGICRS